MKKRLEKAYAYAMPLSKERIDRILVEGKRVVVKFLHLQSLAQRFRIGTKLVFYETGGRQMLLGEASVIKSEMLLPYEVVSQYRALLFINEEEMDAYVNRFPNRTNKKVLTLTLDNMISFRVPIQSSTCITMVGRFLGKEEYDRELRRAYL